MVEVVTLKRNFLYFVLEIVTIGSKDILPYYHARQGDDCRMPKA